MHVVTVSFSIHAAHYADFLREMRLNASESLASEPGCRQFDVCEGANHTVFLYELYDTAADFDAHLQAVHFIRFNQTTAPWAIDKVVKTYTLDTPSK